MANEGRSDETVRILPLRFGPDRSSYAWTVTGTPIDKDDCPVILELIARKAVVVTDLACE